MAILGKIRQRSIFLILVIGMALFAFVISGVFDGNSSNSGTNDPIAIINDEEVGVDFFRQMVDQTQRTYNYSTLKSVNLVWNQALKNTIFDQEFKKLGNMIYVYTPTGGNKSLNNHISFIQTQMYSNQNFYELHKY